MTPRKVHDGICGEDCPLDKELICGYACPHWELADECAGCGYCTVKGRLTKIGDPCDVTTSKLSTVPGSESAKIPAKQL